MDFRADLGAKMTGFAHKYYETFIKATIRKINFSSVVLNFRGKIAAAERGWADRGPKIKAPIPNPQRPQSLLIAALSHFAREVVI